MARVNLSVALVAIVKSRPRPVLEPIREDANRSRTADVCFANDVTNDTKKSGVFNWNSTQQGVVLGSVYYGYVFMPFVGGVLAMKFGGKLTMFAGQTWVAILTILTPVLTTAGDFPVMVVLRVLTGIGQGLVVPSFLVLLTRWAPRDKSTFMTSFAMAGAPIGIMLGKVATGFLTDALGGVTILWAIVWCFVVYDVPSDHPRITRAELDYLTAAVQQSTVKKGSLSVPWRSILSSVRVWAVAITHFCCMYGFFTMKSCLPMYYKEILNFDITANGMASGAPFLVMFLVMTASGFTVDALVKRTRVSATVIKKVAVFLGLVLPACCLVAVGYINCDVSLAVLFIVAAVGLLGMATCVTSGSNQLDLAPSYAGIVVAFSVTFSITSGLVGPSVVGAVTNDNHTVGAWRIVFCISACLHVFGAAFYCVFGTAKQQSWGVAPDRTTTVELNG